MRICRIRSASPDFFSIAGGRSSKLPDSSLRRLRAIRFTPVTRSAAFAWSGRGTLPPLPFSPVGLPGRGEEALTTGENDNAKEEMTMKNEIQQKLEQIALNRSIPFCYGCYKEALTGCCESCGSDARPKARVPDLVDLLEQLAGPPWAVSPTLERRENTELAMSWSVQRLVEWRA